MNPTKIYEERPPFTYVSIRPDSKVPVTATTRGIYINAWLWESHIQPIARSRLSEYSFHGDFLAPKSEWLDFAQDIETLATRLSWCEFNDEIELLMNWLGGSPFKDEAEMRSEKSAFIKWYGDIAKLLRYHLESNDFLWFDGM